MHPRAPIFKYFIKGETKEARLARIRDHAIRHTFSPTFLLQCRHVKATKQRAMLVQFFQATTTPLSVDDLLNNGERSTNRSSLKTIYRTIELFEKQHVIKEIFISGKIHYTLK